MNLRPKLSLITVLSTLIVSVTGVGLLYRLASTQYLQSRIDQLQQETRAQANHQIGIMRRAEDSLVVLAEQLKAQLARPPRPDDSIAFDRHTQREPSGVVRSRKADFDGRHEAGIFIAPGVPLSEQEKRIKIRAKYVLSEFGASALRHFDGIWFDQMNKTSVIFWRRDPDFIFKLPANHDYTQTEWNQLASPARNPRRVPMWTPAILESPVGEWVVSAVYPLDIDGRWEGILGHDLALTGLLQSFRNTDPYVGSEHFLIDAFGNYILAGPWQKALEAKSEGFKPDLSTEPQLRAVLQGGQSLADGSVIHAQGRDYALFSFTVDHLNWRYYRLVPTASVLAPMNELFLFVAGLLFAMAVTVAVVIRFAASRLIVTPVRQLLQAVEQFSAGAFWQRSPRVRNDEVGQLSRSFDTMAQHLAHERQRLMDSEARYRSVVEDIKEVVYQVDEEGRFTYLSPNWQALSGHGPQESLGQHLWHHLDERDRDGKRHEFLQIARGERPSPCQGEYRLRNASGQLRWVEIYIQGPRESGHTYTGSMGDITQRKRAQLLDTLFHELGQWVLRGTGTGALLDMLATRLADIYGCITVLSSREHGVLRHISFGGATVSASDMAAMPDLPYLTNAAAPFRFEDFPPTWHHAMKPYGIQSGYCVPLGMAPQHMGGIIFLDTVAQAFDTEVQTSMQATAERIRLLLRTEADQQWLRLISSALETTINAAFIARADGTIEWVNAALVQLSGYSRAEIIGRNPRMFNSGVQSPGFWQHCWKTISSGKAWLNEVVNRRKNGSHYPVRQTITPIHDAGGAITHYISVQEDIQQEKDTQAQLLHVATHDPLTNLPNRHLLLEHLSQAMNSAQRGQHLVGILFIDLDHFKLINDSLGHTIGDELLRQVTERLNACLRAGDTLARQGGDEFVLLLPGLDAPMDAAVVAQKVLEALRAPIQVDEHVLTTGCSIGISVYPTDGTDPGLLLQNADTAMYMAKDSGRNGFQFYVPEMNTRVVRRMELEKDLRQALANGELLLHYQPQIDSTRQRIVGAEALVRWQHPVRGLIAPQEFIPIAEETGLIVPIGEWVLRTACAQLRAWDVDDLTVAVNVSVRQFRDGAILQAVRDALADTGAPAHRLELEITESLMLEDESAHTARLHQLHDLGVRLALDDFGTGFSSMGYLKHLPFDVLKIDRSFIQDIGIDRGDDAITVSIIGLARNLGMQPLAEGVETPQQQDFLRQHGCHLMQGFLFSHPVPAEEFSALLRENR